MLTSEQAAKNQERYGLNVLTEKKRKSVFRVFLEQFSDFLVVILMISAVVSGILGEMGSAAVILVVITINAVLGTAQTIKAQRSLDSLKLLSAPFAKVYRDGEMRVIPSREVTVGDTVIIEAGDHIPADGILTECVSLQVDESALTGESISVEKSLIDTGTDAALGDQMNKVFSGCFVTYGRGKYEVEKIGMDTEMGKIAGLLNHASDKKTPLQRNLDDFGKKLSVAILMLCAIIFGINVWKGGSIADAFLFAVALAVAAIPEALSSIVTIVLSFGTQKMAKEHAIVRKLQAVEGLGSVSVICSDKTGTLTQNKMAVEYYYVDRKEIPAEMIDIQDTDQKFLLEGSILCNDSSVSDEKQIGDPTETALVILGRNFGISEKTIRERYPRIAEIPFDSNRKLMTTVHDYKGKKIVITKGAADVVLKCLVNIKAGHEVRQITKEDLRDIEYQNIAFSEQGLRVLAFAYKEITWLEKDDECTADSIMEEGLTFLGLIAMMDPPRAESEAAVRACIHAGIKPVMITGDHRVTASAIAKRIGILKDDSEACEGAVIDEMSDEELMEFVEGISVYARVSPEHKIRIVKAWQDKGHVAAMTGDGVNDAPALKQADIGVAMGITGSEVSKDAAAMILTDDNFATIIKAVENGRNIYQNIKNAIRFLLSGNLGAILAVLYAAVTGLAVPFAPVHLLFINLLTDSLPAIALGLEPDNKDVMNQKPRPSKESILTKDYLLGIGVEGMVIALLSMSAFLIGYRRGNAALASTMAFGTLCLARLFHGFNCKSGKPVLFTRVFWNNACLTGAFVIGSVLLTCVLELPMLQEIFHVVSLSPVQLLTVYGMAFLTLPVIQLLKRLKNKNM